MQTHDKIRILREQKQLTQEDMAECLFMSVSGYSKIERGETRLNIERLEQITQILEVDILELLANKSENAIYNLKENFGIIANIHNQYNQCTQIEHLKLIIAHKDELLAQKEKENQRLQILSDKLTQSLTSK